MEFAPDVLTTDSLTQTQDNVYVTLVSISFMINVSPLVEKIKSELKELVFAHQGISICMMDAINVARTASILFLI